MAALTQQTPRPHAPHRRSHPGFVLYVGVDAATGEHPQAELVELAEALGELAREWLPDAETYTALTLSEPATDRHEHLVDEGRRTARGRSAARRSDVPVPAPDLAPDLAPLDDVEAFRDRLAALSPVPRVVIDPASRRVTVDGSEQRLTHKELELLTHLSRSAHRVVTRDELLSTVWGADAVRDGSRTIDVHVRRLREKLGLQHVISTVRGLGYRFDPQTRVVLRGAGDAA
ncbi:winged helix family transcriptional regulator [Oerskovia turbata]|uniref:Winged helix family transcriptional regulator n=1 Tax=Oerskovia turbata TaxID=1713 RepID=A0A4Q1KT59_9CELL|nr:winged helix-turn-helix domain-containing protein [Oerskovia turbata]RXR25259.1 winged helix family transcriptional regulator [Oerskovia turbata]RXR32800.1 winged helix family transcriptional regulator [Oerskovia turbata]TGJ95518.1 winged helix family transcriptional regulator [Actinotalea fermentans ATCC 43279 = JCM 9966 = DSM 3133]